MYRLSKPKCWVDGLSSDLFRLPVLLEFWIPYCPVRWSPCPKVACRLTSQPVCLFVCIPCSSVSAYWIAFNVMLIWYDLLLYWINYKHAWFKLPISLEWLLPDDFFTLVESCQACARNYRHSFRENKPKMLVFFDWIRAFWACFHGNAGL
jgi:hypothetical protein